MYKVRVSRLVVGSSYVDGKYELKFGMQRYPCGIIIKD